MSSYLKNTNQIALDALNKARRKHREKVIPLKRRANVVLLLLIFVVFSCAPVQFSPVKIEHATDLPHFDHFQGLKIGVSAYLDPIQSSETFGTDLFSKGILPILVIIENDTNLTFLLEQKHFALYPAFQRETAESDGTPTTDTANKKADSFSDAVVTISRKVVGTVGLATFTVTILEAAEATETVAAIASLHIPANAIALGAIIPLAIAGEFSSRDIQVTHHMIDEALADRTLHQGQSIRGFLYFPCDCFDEKTRAQDFILRTTLQSISDETVWNVDLPLGRLFPQEAR
jgi:hypothetical protein